MCFRTAAAQLFVNTLYQFPCNKYTCPQDRCVNASHLHTDFIAYKCLCSALRCCYDAKRGSYT